MTTRKLHPRRAVVFAIAVVFVAAASDRILFAALPQAGDFAFGLSNPDATLTIELVTGLPVMDGGTKLTSPWQSIEFVQSVKFDNLGGIRHNVHGNLIGVDFGGPSDTGRIYNLATTVDPSPTPAQKIGDTLGLGGAGLSLNRLAGLSISPNNSKIALTGYTTGAILVYDYTPGDTLGAGASLAGGRQTTDFTLDSGHSQGTAWKDDTTVVAFSSLGNVFEVNSGTMAATLKKTITTPPFMANYTSLAYEPAISPYMYAVYGGFDGISTVNKLFVLDPASNYNLVKEVDLTGTLQTAREIALDKNGNLFLSQYGGPGSGGGVDPDGAALDFIPASMILNPATLTDNSSINWYRSETLSSFSSFDIGFGPATVVGDYNGDTFVNAADYTLWRDTLGQEVPAGDGADGDNSGTIDDGDYTVWKANFDDGSGSGAAGGVGVPEPAALATLIAAMGTLFVIGRRW